MNVLLIGDVAQTGFGRVTRELAKGLLAKGHDLRIIGINWRGVEGELTAAGGKGSIAETGDRIAKRLAELRADPLTDILIPSTAGGDGMGHNLTAQALEGQLWDGWKPDGMILVADPKAAFDRIVHDGGSVGRAKERGIPLLNYVPIEGSGLPADWRIIWTFLQPVAMSAFGQQQIAELMGTPVALAHHGVSEGFYPVSAAQPGTWRGELVTSKDGAKRAIGMADRTVILRTDRYVFRKNYPAWFRVLTPVLKAHPEVVAIAHTVPRDDDGRGNIWQLMSRLEGSRAVGINPWGEAVWDHPQFKLTGWHDSFLGLSDADLNVLYNAADLMVSSTMAEGFGLTLAESLACGVPVVATDYSAVPEVVGPGGIVISPTALLTNPYAHEWALVDEPAMSAAVERLISKPALRRELGAAGRRHVARFTWSAAVDVFDGLLRADAIPAVVA